jgi:hypothetical protein
MIAARSAIALFEPGARTHAPPAPSARWGVLHLAQYEERRFARRSLFDK